MNKELNPICNCLRAGMGHKAIAKLLNVNFHAVRRISGIKRPRILFPADLHCGSNVGLTPPAYQYKYYSNPVTEEHKKRNKWAALQKEAWEWYIRTLDMLRPFDKCFVMGDLNDGDGSRSGGTELITTDRKVQTGMAIECLEPIQASGMIFVYGTGYHTGTKEDWENDVAGHFKSKIGSHEWEEINGCVFDLKHHQSATRNPGTSLYNEVIDNREWAVLEEQPKANVLVRAHTHRFAKLQLEDCIAISTPALQTYGTKFGSRRCSRKVQFGLFAVDVWPDGVIQEHVHIAKLQAHKTSTN